VSGNETSALIDRLAEILSPHIGSDDAADAIATEIVGNLQSRYVMVSKTEVDAARADLERLDIPGLMSTRGRS
jgi:hypothetical protein